MAGITGVKMRGNATITVGKATNHATIDVGDDGDFKGEIIHFDVGDNAKLQIGDLENRSLIQGPKSDCEVDEDGFTNSFKRVLVGESDLDPYKLTGKCGVLILCNIFKGTKENRLGAIEDIKAMKDLFEKLGCDVESHKEISSRDLDTIITKFQLKLKENKSGSCIIIIMSHCGKSANSILMEDQKEKNLYRDFVYKFSHESFPEFKEKPKIFLVQACQNYGDDELENNISGLDIQEDNLQSTNALGKVTIEDFLVSFATIPYQPALRLLGSRKQGSFFIQAIKEEFGKYALKRRTLRKMMYNVGVRVAEDCKKHNKGQCVSSLESGFKTYIFNNYV